MKQFVLSKNEAEQNQLPKPHAMNKFKHMLDFLKEESREFKPVHQLRNQGPA